MYRIRIELGKEAEEQEFLRYKRSLELEEERAEFRRKQRRTLVRNVILYGSIVLLIFAIVLFIKLDVDKAVEISDINYEIEHSPVYSDADPVIDRSIIEELEEIERQRLAEEEAKRALMYSAQEAEELQTLNDTILSEYAIVVDPNTDTILSSRNGKARISPASMTKILTILVAYENIKPEQLDDMFTITSDINYYSYRHGCSAVGFSDDETVPVRDLFYGTILPSGGEAALALATYVAGSQEDFVYLMNQKLETLGLSETAHFTNCIGLYDEDHYCSVYDMAMILHAAIDNEFCKKVLSTKIYTTASTAQHPDGIEISNWFLRRIEDKPCGGEVICAKTGFVNESGNCSASYGSDGNGNDYIVVTAKAPGNWKCIYDHVRIYRQFFPGYDAGEADVVTENEVETSTDE